MILETTVVISCISAVAAIIAAIIAASNFQRQRTFENENHLYKHKIEQYQIIILHANDLLDLYQEKMDQVLNERPDKTMINSIAGLIDTKTEEFRRSLIKYSLFLPQGILNKLGVFYELLYNEVDTSAIDTERIKESLIPMQKKLDEVTNLIRNDIGIEALNFKLNKRIKTNII